MTSKNYLSIYLNSVIDNQGTGSTDITYYYSSDNKLVLVLDFVGGYYTGMAMDWKTPSPAGHSFNIKIEGTALSANATGEF